MKKIVCSIWAIVLILCSATVFAAGSPEGKSSAGADAGAPWATPLAKPILWYIRGSTADTADIEAVNKALNAALAAKGFNAGVKIEYINRPDYDTKMNLINTSGEQFDLSLVTEGWVNKYRPNVDNEFLIPLSAYKNPKTGKTEHLIKDWATELWKTMPQTTWEAARIKGEIYAVINQQIFVKPFGISIRQDVMNALGLKDAIDKVKTWDELTPIMDRIQKAISSGALKGKVEMSENLTGVFATCDLVKVENFDYEILTGPFAVNIFDKSMKVVNWYETPEYRKAAKLRRSWTDAGYTTKDDLDPQTQITAYKAGQYVMDVGRLVKPGGALEQAARMGFSWYERPISTAFVSTSGPTSAMTGLSSVNESDPDRVHVAMKLLEIVNTDPVLYNLVAKGIEGVHWNWVDKDKKLISLVAGSKYNPNVDWAIGNQFNAYYIDPKQVGAWAETHKLNNSAIPSVMLGFRFDGSSVKTESSAYDTVNKEFSEPIGKGLKPDVDQAIAELVANVKKTGIEKIQAELQKQIDAWKAMKK